MKTNKLNVYSIFPSIDGEVNGYSQGALTVFIRLAGCNLRCQYPCDTEYSFDTKNSKQMTIEEIVNEVGEYKFKKITITGGEPLLQFDNLLLLVRNLSMSQYYISLETNGSQEWRELLKYVNSIIVDYKLPSSGMQDKMLPIKYFEDNLCDKDFIKFVILNKKDFDMAIEIQRLSENSGAKFAYSPVYKKLNPQTLLKWMQDAKINAVLNLQLHKILGLKEDK